MTTTIDPIPEAVAAPVGIGPAPTAPSTGRKRFRVTRWKVLVNLTRLAVIGGALLAWERFAGDPTKGRVLIDQFYVSRPSAIWDAFTGWIDEGVLITGIWVTLQETVFGFLIGAVLGLITGFILGTSRFISAVFRPIVTALNSIPRLALVPLFILWFGLGMSSKMAFVAMIVFFLVFFNTYAGVSDVDDHLLDVLRLMKAKRWQLHTKVTLMSAMTWIIAGLRVSVPYALVAAVTAEMIASNRGMGYLVVRSSGQFFTAGVFAGILVLMVVAMGLTGLVTLLERRLLRWKPDRLQLGR
jgi:NitT/TauT family transport system permease protein